MKSFVLNKFGSIQNLTLQETDMPKIKDGEVLIKTKAIGINPVDYKTRMGRSAAQRLSFPIILGWDVSGEIVKTKSSKFEVGDTVFGMINFPGEGKTYAEYVVASQDHITVKPQNISYTQAAAIPLVTLTAYQALVANANIKQNTTVLIIGASGGVGHVAVQIAKEKGAYVIAVASKKNKKYLLELGIDKFIDYNSQKLDGTIDSIDVALDCVGADQAIKAAKLIKSGGMLISLVGPLPSSLKKAHPDIQMPWVIVHSSAKDMDYIANLITQNKLRVHIHKLFTFENLPKAHEYMQNNSFRGKIVVTC